MRCTRSLTVGFPSPTSRARPLRLFFITASLPICIRIRRYCAIHPSIALPAPAPLRTAGRHGRCGASFRRRSCMLDYSFRRGSSMSPEWEILSRGLFPIRAPSCRKRDRAMWLANVMHRMRELPRGSFGVCCTGLGWSWSWSLSLSCRELQAPFHYHSCTLTCIYVPHIPQLQIAQSRIFMRRYLYGDDRYRHEVQGTAP